MDGVYAKIKLKSPFHVVAKIQRIVKPDLALGICKVDARVLKIHTAANSEWRKLKRITFGIKCKKHDAYVSPKDPTRWLDAERLRKGTVVDAYLAATGQRGTFEPSKFNLIRVISQRGPSSSFSARTK